MTEDHPLLRQNGVPREPGPDAPLVSVVIPAYNCAGTVAATIESCLAQDYHRVEIIVVNDGSTDGTAEVLAGFGPRIKVVSQPNGGLASARNAGQRMATGTYVAWMDADDIMARDRISVQAGVLATQPEIGLVSSDFSSFVDVDADVEASHIASYYDAVPRQGGVAALYPICSASVLRGLRPMTVRSGRIYEALVWGNFVHPPTVMVRRDLLERAGPCDETLRYSSDYDLIVRLARLATFGYVDAPLLRYRWHPGQMSHAGGTERMQLETVRILEKLQREDPEMAMQQAPIWRLRIAESLVHAAAAVGSSDRVRALKLLAHGARRKVLVGASLIALARIVVPAGLVPPLKHALRAVFRWAMLLWTVAPQEFWDLVGVASPA